MDPKEKASFSVVVPVHNAEAVLGRVLDALIPGLLPGDELIVVDDRSTDGSRGVAESRGIVVVESGGPPGAAGTRNSGASRATGDWLLFVDSDAVPPAGWRIALAASVDEAEALQAVYSRVATGRAAATFLKNHYYHYTFTRRIRTRYIPGCGTFFFAVRRSVFESLGGFDERVRGATIEDADFAARLTAGGGRILLLRDLEILHLREYDLPGLLRYDWNMVKAKTRYILRRDRSHGRLSLSMAGPGEMLPVMVGAVAAWLLPAGIAGLAASAPAAPWVASAALAGLAASQGAFWASAVRSGGARGALACLMSLPDLMVIIPAGAAGALGALAGRRY